MTFSLLRFGVAWLLIACVVVIGVFFVPEDYQEPVSKALTSTSTQSGDASTVVISTSFEPATVVGDDVPQALAGAMKSDSVEVRKQIVKALAHIDNASSQAVMQQALQDSSSDVRLSAVTAIAMSLNKEWNKLDLLAQALQDSELVVREQAMLGLASSDKSDALHYLLHAAEHDVDAGNRALAAMLAEARASLNEADVPLEL